MCKTIFLVTALMLGSMFFSDIRGQHFGFGNDKKFSLPFPAYGSSPDVKHIQKDYWLDPSKIYTISGSSFENELSVAEINYGDKKIVPFTAGTEPGLKPSGLNSKQQSSDIFYSMTFEYRLNGWAWYINFNWDGFYAKLNELGGQGFRIENIDTYGDGYFAYGGTWTMDQTGWYWLLNYSDLNTFVGLLHNWPNGTPRLRLTDFAINCFSGIIYYGAVAVSDNLGFWWIFNEGNYSNFLSWVNTKLSSGQRLTELELYTDPDGNILYAGATRDGLYSQQIGINLSFAEFTAMHNQYYSQGYRIIDFDRYYSNGNTYFAAIWNNDAVGGSSILNETNIAALQSQIDAYLITNFKPIMVNVFDHPGNVSSSGDKSVFDSFSLNQNYPNPFNPSTSIKYSIPSAEFITIKVTDLLGREIAVLVNEQKSAGTYDVNFNPVNLSSGIYLYTIKAGEYIQSKKMSFVK